MKRFKSIMIRCGTQVGGLVGRADRKAQSRAEIDFREICSYTLAQLDARSPPMNRFKLTLSALVFLFFLSGERAGSAQSTLINVPSTGVVATKKVYLEFDFLTNYAWQREGSFQNYIPRTVIGIGRNVEVGANVSYTHVSGESLPIEIQPNIKWQVYINGGNGMAIAVGCILYTPVTPLA